MRPQRIQWLFFLLVPLLVVACSDDDDGEGPTGPTTPTDTVAPVVVSMDPEPDDVGVGLQQSVVVTFSEAMDPDTVDGQVTLSTGTVTSTAWTDPSTLQIGHDGWTEGERVDIGLGTGLTDVAGNALAQAFAAGFWTQTSAVSLLSTVPSAGATDVDRNTTVRMMFSHPMLVGSVESAITVDVGAGNPAPGFTVTSGAEDWLVMSFDADLPAEQLVTITVDTSAQSADPVSMDQPAVFSFTTGSGLDTTPPELVSVTPALTGGISPSTSSLVFEFSEPVDPTTFEPSRLGAQFMLLIDGFEISPIWSADNTVLTLPLPTPLPQGLPIVADFDGFTDTAGNVATGTVEVDLWVEGTPLVWAFVDGMTTTVLGEEQASGTTDGFMYEWLEYRQTEALPGGRFRIVSHEDAVLSQPDDYEVFRPSSSVIEFVGFGSENPDDLHDVTFDVPVDYLRLPLAPSSWSGQTTASFDGETVTISYTVTVIEQVDIGARLGDSLEGSSPPLVSRAADDGPQLEWIDAWRTELEYEMSVDGTTIESGVDEIHYAPGVGPVRWVSQNTDHIADETWSSVRDVVEVDMEIGEDW